MTLAVFFGCTFIAFGPALGLFLFTIARDPLRIIILIAGAFFWLVSLLLSSLIWFIAVKASDPNDEQLQKGLLIFGVMFSVLLQEAFRFLYYKLLRKAIEGLVALSEDGCSPISIQQMAYVAGVGFGLMSGAFSMINLLADALGPGTVGIYGDSQLYFLTSDVLQPPVRGQPGALLRADGCRCHLGLPALRGICPERASFPALFTEWSQPPARILRPCRMFLSPAAPCPPLRSVGESGHHLFCNIFSPGMGDTGLALWGRHSDPAAAASRLSSPGLARSSAPLGAPAEQPCLGDSALLALPCCN
ncbi:gamma-secretase subunit Aph-1b-like isoform X1 [Apteryx mantelli]|uniref:Gamma-secretase subunit APH-1 n=1 Tax=Apteryx mantelli TaxID=2696672 RepID=A0ABM4G4E2_9AVES